MSLGQQEIYDRLIADSNVTDKLDLYLTEPAIFKNDLIMPQSFQGKGINFYRVNPLSGAIPYRDTLWTLNCRAEKQKDAEAIAQACFDNLNLYRAGVIATSLLTIPPADSTDTYNAPVEIQLKKER